VSLILNILSYKKEKFLSNNYFLVIVIAFFSLIVLWPLLARDGWPYNHEWLSWKYRLICYADHFKQGDFFPLWSSGEAYGLGSPLPLYYHKLFYYFSALVFLVINDVKNTFVFCLVVINFVGVFGLFKTLRRVGVKTEIALLVSLSLLFQYYTITDWFIRGAFAEYLAMMITPWFFYWAFGLLIYRKYSYSIGFILGLTYLAHSIIAYYMLYAILMTQLCDFYYNRPSIKLLFKPYLKAALIFILMIGLVNFPIIITSKYYDPSYIKFDINYFFHDIISYFYDNTYSFNKTWEGYSVQLNPISVVFILLSGILSVFFIKDVKKQSKLVYIFLTVIFCFYAILQFRFSIAFYNFLPGADYIQFPWRLLSFIQICMLLILGVMFNGFTGYRYLKFLGLVYLVVIVCRYPLFHATSDTWQWFTEQQLEERKNEGVYGIGEYMPVVKGFEKPDRDFFKDLAAKGIQTSNSLNFVEAYQENGVSEKLELKYRMNLVSDDTIILPINFSGLEKSLIVKENETQIIKPYRIETDPRVRLDLPKGSYHVILYLPSMKNFFR
jgi:hypothetical protein